MSVSGLTAFDSTIHTTNTWLKELMEDLGWEDRQRAYHALRAVLHALRDRLPLGEVVTLGAQLPMLVRGFYYEGWHPAEKSPHERRKDEFLAQVTAAFRAEAGIHPEEIVRAVFHLLHEHVAPGEVERIKHALPHELRSLWT
jgi:uncharacterized protein (DUF2267 family)